VTPGLERIREGALAGRAFFERQDGAAVVGVDHRDFEPGAFLEQIADCARGRRRWRGAEAGQKAQDQGRRGTLNCQLRLAIAGRFVMMTSSSPRRIAMKAALTAFFVAATVTCLATSADAQRSRYRQNQGVSQDAYNQCLQLAFRRGQNLSNGDRKSLELFLDACLRGRIPF
jgi:hypothetical protein